MSSSDAAVGRPQDPPTPVAPAGDDATALARLIDSCPEGIVGYGHDLCVTTWNTTIARWTGVAAAAARGRRIDELLPVLSDGQAIAGPADEDTDEATAEVRNGATGGPTEALAGHVHWMRDVPFAFPGVGRDGVYDLHLAPVRDERGSIAGGIVVLYETTEARRRADAGRVARDALRTDEHRAALEAAVAGLGHDLCNPLSVVQNHLYLLKMLAERMEKEDPEMAPVAAEILERCRRSMDGIKRMSATIDEVRDAYRLGDVEVEEVDLKEVVAAGLREHAATFPRAVQVRARLEATGPVPLRPDHLKRLLSSLLDFAAASSRDGGTVQVTVRPVAEGAEWVVSYDGAELDEETRTTLFSPLHVTRPGATGPGLVLARQIVDRHLGTLTCGRGPGDGTEFRIFLPRLDSKGDESVAGHAADPGAQATG